MHYSISKHVCHDGKEKPNELKYADQGKSPKIMISLLLVATSLVKMLPYKLASSNVCWLLVVGRPF